MISFIIVVIVGCIIYVWVKYDFLAEFEPITDDELLLLSLVDEEYFKDLLIYARTLEMHPKLQAYLKDNKPALEALSFFMLAQSAKREQEKKDDWEKQRTTPKAKSQMTYNEKIILRRLQSSKKR